MKNPKLILKRRFEGEKFKKIILYRNPNECDDLKLERVNPDHIGIIWGRRKKALNKGTNYTQIAKVYFQMLPMVFGLSVASWLDALTNYTYNILISVSYFSILTSVIVSAMFYGYIVNYTMKVSKTC